MAARRKTQVLEPITPQQQQFIEALLTGKSITDAALTAKLSRRTATYWMNDAHHPVRVEYEKQRLASLATVASRVASLHGLAFSALEDLLAPSAPPAVRFQAAKLIYEAHLQGFCEPTPPQSTAELVAKELISRSAPIGYKCMTIKAENGFTIWWMLMRRVRISYCCLHKSAQICATYQ